MIANADLLTSIKGLRKSRHLTQREVTKMAKVPYCTVNRMEKQKANPTIGTVQRILNIYGYELCIKKTEVSHVD